MESVLVCIFPTTRAHRLSFKSIKRHVLDELNADLALAVAIDENYDYENRFWQHAKYRWTAPSFKNDLGEAYDFAQGWLCRQRNIPVPDWRLMLQIKGVWQGGIRCQNPEPSHSAIFPFGRWLLLRGLQQDGILDRYDRFVLTRSEFVWLCPHPPLSLLDRDAIWVPTGAQGTIWPDYGGLNDRHLIVSRADVVNCLNLLEDILLQPTALYEELKSKEMNNEQLLAHHLSRKRLLHKVKRFPNVMYLAREVNDDQKSWSWGHYETTAGHYVKYPDEFRAAKGYESVIRSRVDWQNGAWREFDFSTVVNSPPRLASFLHRLWHSWEAPYYRILSGTRRPHRLRRLTALCKAMFKN